MSVQLEFVETVRAGFPQATNGSGTGMTTVLRYNDPYLAFLTQIPGQDRIHFLLKSDLTTHDVIRTPPGRNNCTGLGFDPISRMMIMCFPLVTSPPDPSPDQIVEVDPETGREGDVIVAPRPQYQQPSWPTPINYAPQGVATNGLLVARASEVALMSGSTSVVELFTRTGRLLGGMEFPGRRIRGLTNSPWSWAFVDQANHEIVIVDPFGQEIAKAPGVGPAGTQVNLHVPRGMASIAFDMQGHRTMQREPQEWLPGGRIGAPGTINHPDTPWSPEPWGGRHKVFIANESDQTIYGGYFTKVG